jgi:hypothetical protein
MGLGSIDGMAGWAKCAGEAIPQCRLRFFVSAVLGHTTQSAARETGHEDANGVGDCVGVRRRDWAQQRIPMPSNVLQLPSALPAPEWPKSGHIIDNTGVPYGIRTRVTNVKGWCPRPLDERDRSKLLMYQRSLWNSLAHYGSYSD